MPDEAAKLLRWYDVHARDLPWRVPPRDERRPDPYHVWLSEIMLQQTTVAAVVGYFNRFVTRWPTVEALAAARDEDVMAAWAGLGYYARARNLLRAARAVAVAGKFPDTEDGLRALPGIGAYTAAAIAAIAFGRRAVVVDGNVERVMARYFALRDPLPGVKAQIRACADSLTPVRRPGDYAQAVMDLGATICLPRMALCVQCPLAISCAALAEGIVADLPARAPKTTRPERKGHVFYGLRSDGAVLLERRPGKGLLGGMLGFPGSGWNEEPLPIVPPVGATWRRADRTVSHVFTHFRLTLTVHVANLDMDVKPDRGDFVLPYAFTDRDLPTVFRKVYRVGHAELAE